EQRKRGDSDGGRDTEVDPPAHAGFHEPAADELRNGDTDRDAATVDPEEENAFERTRDDGARDERDPGSDTRQCAPDEQAREPRRDGGDEPAGAHEDRGRPRAPRYAEPVLGGRAEDLEQRHADEEDRGHQPGFSV